MRYVALLCISVVLSGCLDEHANVEDRMPQLLKNDSLIKHPYLRRMPTTEQEWTRFIQTLNAQPVANVGNVVELFTPTWTGFSVDPVGDISYMDLGAFVIMWSDRPTQLVGTSDTTTLIMSGVPETIWPDNDVVVPSLAVDNSNTILAVASVAATGEVQLGVISVSGAYLVAGGATAFTASGDKGLPPGWLIVYAK